MLSVIFDPQQQALKYLAYLCLMTKHEIIPCERCGSAIECKANAYTKCQCSVVQLNLNEVQYISELYDGCLCAKCLFELQLEYRETVAS